jgi:hypothetical protein
VLLPYRAVQQNSSVGTNQLGDQGMGITGQTNRLKRCLVPVSKSGTAIHNQQQTMKAILCALVVTVSGVLSALPASAADSPKNDKQPAKVRALPFQGKIDAIDQQAKTIKIGERTFQVTSETKITKDSNPATLADAKVGDEVGLSYRQTEDKKLNLVSLRIGPKPAKKK